MKDYMGEVSYYNCGKVIHGDFQRARKDLQKSLGKIEICSMSMNGESIPPSFAAPLLTLGRVWTVMYQRKEGKFILESDKKCSWGLTYVEKGSLDNIVDGIKYNLCQDEVLFYNEEQSFIQWIGDNTPVCFYTIFFDMDLEESIWIENHKFLVDFEMKELMHKLINERSEQNYFTGDIIACYLKEFIIMLLRNDKYRKTACNHYDKASNNEERMLVEKSIEYIKRNIGKKIIVAEIAKSIHVSKSYLFMIFKKHMNMTIVEYINNTKLEKSRQLILTSGYNLTEIADILGYASIHYFSSQFKLKYGVNPSKFASMRKLNTVV